MLITFTHAYRPCWLANAIELCTKQTRSRVCVTHPLAAYKTARCSLILATKTLVRTRYVQFTYFTGRVYCTTHTSHSHKIYSSILLALGCTKATQINKIHVCLIRNTYLFICYTKLWKPEKAWHLSLKRKTKRGNWTSKEVKSCILEEPDKVATTLQIKGTVHKWYTFGNYSN